jgi:hypothetical protein
VETGNTGIRETTVVTSDAPGGIAGRRAVLNVNQTALDNTSANRVCQPGPVAFQRTNASGGNRIEIDVRALPDLGRPRGLNILAADAAPKISGNTSRALGARAKVPFVQAGSRAGARRRRSAAETGRAG